jgi:hypothetical protein
MLRKRFTMGKNLYSGATVFLAALFLTAQPALAIDLSKISFNGYIDLEYSSADNAEGNYNSSFRQHHLVFLLDIPVSDKLSAYTQVEFNDGADLSGQDTTDRGPSTSSGSGNITVENAFIKYAHSDAIQFRLGKMLTPFGYYNEIHDATPAIISIAVPKAINDMTQRGGAPMFPEWNTGVNMLGTIVLRAGTVDYSIYAGNGENPPGWNSAASDANPNKAFGARVNFQAFERLQIGASVYNGDIAFESTAPAQIQSGSHTATGILLSMNGDKLFFLSEYAISQEQGFTASAGYGQFTYLLLKRLSAYYRLEYSNPNESVSDDTWIEHIAGVNYRPLNISNLVLKFELSDNIRGGNNPAVVKDNIYKEARFAVTLFF